MMHRHLAARVLLCGSTLWFLAFATDAWAMSVSPAWAPDGNYTVSWSHQTGCVTTYYPGYPDVPMSYQCWYLQEKAGSGAWTDIQTADGSMSWNASGKSQNTYEYQIFSYYCDYAVGCYNAVAEGPVIVGVGPAPPTDPLTTQLTYQFQTRSGDINWDGRIDLFVRRTSGGVSGNGVLDQIILQQNSSGGTFSLVVPNSSQSAIASSWPLSSATVILTDFNVDGFVDVEVKGIAAAIGVSGAADQIVFSPAAFYETQPLGLRAVDASLKKFVANSLDYFVNPDYYTQNAVPRYYSGYFIYFVCPYSINGILDVYYYGIWPCQLQYFSVSGTYMDYTDFSTEAIVIWSNDEAYATSASTIGDSTSSAQEAAESAIGVPIGGWEMEEVLGPTGEHTDPDVRRGLETFWSILGIARANAQEIDTDEAPAQTPRTPGTIYLTSRVIAGGWSRHAAIEYTTGFTPYKTISAYDSDPSPGNDSTLISEKNWSADAPERTMTTGVITPPGTTANDDYWFLLLAADTNYDDNLPYDAIPGLGTGGYNSNGYARGIIEVTGGNSSFPIDVDHGFVGGEFVVPQNSFY